MKIEIEIPDEIAESIGEHAVRQAWLEHDRLCLWVLESGRHKARLREVFWRSLAAQLEQKEPVR